MEKTEDIDIEKLLAGGRRLEDIANAMREIESMRLDYNVRSKITAALKEKENKVIGYLHLGKEQSKGSE
ncbi:hypothetical protein KAX02_06425 [candidate division WOR-3 bacterium]|nr:hypothetical protein [candidate division WOR-3 bacterium]